MIIPGDELVIPVELAGDRVERNDRIGVKIIAWPFVLSIVGKGVSNWSEHLTRSGVERITGPESTACRGNAWRCVPGFGPGFDAYGDRVKAPELLAGSGVKSHKTTPNARVADAGTDIDFAIPGDRR